MPTPEGICNVTTINIQSGNNVLVTLCTIQSISYNYQ